MAIVWADAGGHDLAHALEDLITETFGGRVLVWHSTREIGGADWRADVQRAAHRSVASILALGPNGAGAAALMYQAGACFRDGTTFAVGCGADAAELWATPLEALRICDAHDRAKVKDVIRAVGLAAGEWAGAFENGFAAASPTFQRAIEQLHGSVKAQRTEQQKADTKRRNEEADARKWAGRRRVATIVLLAAALIVIAIAPWAWTLWPAPALPAACTSGSGEQRAQCEWDRLVSGSRGTAARDRAAGVAARPFAIVAFTPTCDAGAVAHDVRIAGQGATGNGWGIPVVFAKAGADTTPGIFSAVTVAHGGRVDVLATGRCVALDGGAIRVRYVGTLGDRHLCHTLRDSRQAFGGNPGFVDQFASFLGPFQLDAPDRLRTGIAGWLALCGVL